MIVAKIQVSGVRVNPVYSDLADLVGLYVETAG